MPKFYPKKINLKDGREIILRSLMSGDQQEVRSYMRQVAQESQNTLKYEGMPEPSDERYEMIWSDAINSEADLCLGAFSEGELIAYLRFFQKRPDHQWLKHMGSFGLSVKMSYWGQGLATQLLEVLDDECRTHGITRIEAEVRASNERGVKLYTKNGYKIEGLREKAAYINDVYEDEYFIAKILL